jgi:drug/metabolite transporter superfamily protein YnfA
MTLNNPTPTTNGNFGFAVAIDGNKLVIGAPFQAVGATVPGRAYVYDLESATPNIPAVILNNPTPASGDGFGYSVAIAGARVVIGAPNDSTGAAAAGSAYVYNLNGASPGTPVLSLNNPEPASGDRFGFSVAISGTRVLVGAEGDDTGARDAGAAYVYDLSSSTPSVPIVTLNNPFPDSQDHFGNSVAISGSFAVVGASQDNQFLTAAGGVYVYDLTTPDEPESFLSKPIPVAHDHFGACVALDGTTVVVGAPLDDTTGADRGAVYVFGLAPTLSIEPDGPGFIRLSWMPANAPGFVLQQTDSFAPAGWITAPSGATNPVTISATNAARFYRLAQP